MARAFAEIAFTDSVKAAQSRYGSRKANTGFELDEDRRDTLGGHELAFLAGRDSFYIASVGENGWPYVQHRGGPKGFLKVLDEKTLGFADFRGNRQYISIDNLNADGLLWRASPGLSLCGRRPWVRRTGLPAEPSLGQPRIG
jgi:hypothetical protein